VPAEATIIPSGALPDAPTYPIWGYAGSQSVSQGGDIDLHISTRAPTYSLIFYRYGASGLEQKTRVDGLPGSWHDCQNSHLGCGWPVSHTLNIPGDWRSGLYCIRLLTPGENPSSLYGEWIFFIVREDRPGSTSPVLLALNDATWQAYNYRSGLSFYPDTSTGRGRANYLSFDRPYGGPSSQSTDLGPCSLQWTCPPWRNLPLIRWLETNNYLPEYASNYDVHSIPDLVSHYRLFMDDAHDEYWSWQQRDQVEDFIRRGGNAMFLSSNTSYWQVRYEDGGRTLVGFKNEYSRDPVMTDSDPSNDHLTTYNWCRPPVNRCETQMTGITYWNGGNAKESACPSCTGGFNAWQPNHWIWAGTGIKQGQLFRNKGCYGSTCGIASTEVDGAQYTMTSGSPVITPNAVAEGTPSTFQILGVAPASVKAGTMGVYTNTAGATVWSSGSWDWAVVGLSLPDPYVDKATRNLLDRLAFNAPWPETRMLSQPLGAGWNLVSMPYTPADGGVANVFTSIGGHYDLVEAYDGCQADNPWRIYDPTAPSFVNTLTQVGNGVGLWVHTTSAPTLELTGRPLVSDVTLTLCTGWNLVGYPSTTERDVATVLAPINGKFDLVEGYDGTNPGNPWLIYDPAAPSFVNTLTQFHPGKGYWIHMNLAASLTIPH